MFLECRIFFYFLLLTDFMDRRMSNLNGSKIQRFKCLILRIEGLIR